jgi:hypothetical protein
MQNECHEWYLHFKNKGLAIGDTVLINPLFPPNIICLNGIPPRKRSLYSMIEYRLSQGIK